jgi:hypothetical protein
MRVSKKYLQSVLMAFLCLLMWFRQANSTVVESLGYPILLSHGAFALAIILGMVLYGQNALKIVRTTPAFRILFFALFVFVCWFYLSNNLADLALMNSSNWSLSEVFYYDWLLSIAILLISIGVVDGVITSGCGKRFLMLLIIFSSIVSMLLFYLYIFSFAAVLSGDANDGGLFSGGNKMILGKMFFVNIILMTACLRYAVTRSKLIKAALVLGHLIIAIFMVIVSVRTALLAWLLLVLLIALIGLKGTPIRKLAFGLFVFAGIALFVILLCTSFLLAGVVSLGYSPNYFFDIATSPLGVLDEVLSSRYTSALFGISMFMETIGSSVFHAFIGFGNEWSAVLFKGYYGGLVEVAFPSRDLSWYWEQGASYSPHNSIVDILISNGLIGFLIFASILFFVFHSIRNLINKRNKYARVQIDLFLALAIVVIGFFATDVDFSGGKIILHLFFVLFITIVILDKRAAKDLIVNRPRF